MTDPIPPERPTTVPLDSGGRNGRRRPPPSQPMIDRERLRKRLVQLTRDLVIVRSTEEHPEERRKCFQLICNHLEDLPGIAFRRLEKDGFESLVALPQGCERPEVLLCGHLDVVEHPGEEPYDSELRDGRICGPGTGDMKGQLAILVQLARHFWGGPTPLPVGLVISSDEERGGESGVKYLVEEAGLVGGIALIPDGGSLTDVIVAEKGILHLRLTATGRAAHAARPWLGRNAAESLLEGLRRVQAEIFDPLRPARVDPDDLDTHWFPTCSVTMLETTNDSRNRIPDSASAVLDVRFPAPGTVAEYRERIAQTLGEGISTEILVAAEPTLLDPDPLFLEKIAEVTGGAPRLVRACGGSDARFFHQRGIPVVLSRPRVGNLHGRDEWIDVESMLDYFEICRLYVAEKVGSTAA